MEVASQISPGVDKLHQESAGGRIRFSTDSPFMRSFGKRILNCRIL